MNKYLSITVMVFIILSLYT